MKFGPVLKAVAAVVLACLMLAAIRFLDRIPAHRLDATPTPTADPVRTEPQASGQVAMWSRSTVAVQAFTGSTLVASGAGTAVSSDGLILTTSWAAPYGSGSYVYQVATSDGAVLRAGSVWRGSGLVLLKVDAVELDAALFDDSASLYAGQELILVGAFMHLSQYVPVIVPAVVPYITDARHAVLSFDRAFSSSLVGSRIIDRQGSSVGLFWPAGPQRILFATDINDVLERYLATQRRQ